VKRGGAGNGQRRNENDVRGNGLRHL